MVFLAEPRRVERITVALQTVTPEHRNLRQISIYVPYCLTPFDIGANGGRTARGDNEG